MYMSKKMLFTVLLAALSSFVMGTETGGASWYGGKFQGRLTANGEIFDTDKFTAAHKTLPFNTIVKVTNLSNNKSVLVRINDRGPFVAGRIIDLSRAAAEKIGLVGKGVVQVMLKVVTDTTKLFGAESSPVLSGLKPPGSGPASLVTLQVASYTNERNAERTKKILVNNDFHPKLEFTSEGFIRILLTGIPKTNISAVKNRLAYLGFQSAFLRHE